MRSARIAGLVVALSLAVTGIGSSQTADSPIQLTDISIERASDGASVTVKTSGPAQYEAKLIDTPTRLVIDVTGATYGSTKARWTSGVEPVKEVRASQFRKGIARVVVEMTQKTVGYHIDETPTGLVIAVDGNSASAGPETKSDAKMAIASPDAPKPAAKPAAAPKPAPAAPVDVTKVADKSPTMTASATDPSAPAPKAPKPAVVAAAKPVDKPASASCGSVSSLWSQAIAGPEHTVCLTSIRRMLCRGGRPNQPQKQRHRRGHRLRARHRRALLRPRATI